MMVETKYEIHLCASDDDTRTHLNYVQLDVEGKRLMATDGHMLATIPCEIQAGDVSGPIPRKLLGQAIKAARKDKQEHAQLLCGETTITVDGVIHPRTQAEAFPPVDCVIRAATWAEGETTFTVGLNPALLLDLAKSVGADRKSPAVELTFKISGADARLNPILVKPYAGAPEVGLLMPCRV